MHSLKYTIYNSYDEESNMPLLASIHLLKSYDSKIKEEIGINISKYTFEATKIDLNFSMICSVYLVTWSLRYIPINPTVKIELLHTESLSLGISFFPMLVSIKGISSVSNCSAFPLSNSLSALSRSPKRAMV